LRKEIDHLLNNGQPPRLVVYVPVERAETHSALIELDCAGVIMQPRQQPPACNTRLSVVARNALKPILGEDQVAEIERQAEAGILTPADLNSLAGKGKDISTGVLTLIFGSANPQDVALAFLQSDQHDEEIGEKSAAHELRNLLHVSFDIELPSSATFVNWRERLARHILLTDLVAALGEHVPAALASAKVAISQGSVNSCVRLARSWRNNRDSRDNYADAANRVEKEFQLDKVAFDPSGIARNETFLAVERASLRYIEERLVHDAGLDLLQVAVVRQSGFWAEFEPAVQARWALIAAAAEALITADRLAEEFKNPPATGRTFSSSARSQARLEKRCEDDSVTTLIQAAGLKTESYHQRTFGGGFPSRILRPGSRLGRISD
jgi:hypothetical protein